MRFPRPNPFKEFVTAFHAELNRLRGSQDAEQEAAHSEIARIDRQLERLVDAVLDGGDTRILNAKMRDLEARKEALQARLAEAKVPQPRLHPNLVEVYRRKIADLHEALDSPALGHQAMEQVRALVDKVELMPRCASTCTARSRGSWRCARKAESPGMMSGLCVRS